MPVSIIRACVPKVEALTDRVYLVIIRITTCAFDGGRIECFYFSVATLCTECHEGPEPVSCQAIPHHGEIVQGSGAVPPIPTSVGGDCAANRKLFVIALKLEYCTHFLLMTWI